MTAAGGCVMHRSTDECGHALGAPVPGQAGCPAAARRGDRAAACRVGEFLDGAFRDVLDRLAVPDQPPRRAVPDGVAQAVGVEGDGGHAERRGLQDAQPPALALGGVQVQQRPGDDLLLACLGDEAVQPDRAAQAAGLDGGGQGRGGGAAPDHLAGQPAARQALRDGQQQFGALVRDQAAHPGHGPAGARGLRRSWLRGAVGDQVDVAGPAQPVAHRGDRGRGDRHAGVPPVGQPGGRPFQHPAGLRHPAREVHAELGGVHVVHHAEHRHPPGQHARGEERDPVLAVEHGIEGPPVREQPAEHARVHGEPAAHPGHRDPVVAAAPGLPGRPRGQEHHPRSPGDQAAADLPGITFRTAGVRVPGVPPVGDGDPQAGQIGHRGAGGRRGLGRPGSPGAAGRTGPPGAPGPLTPA